MKSQTKPTISMRHCALCGTTKTPLWRREFCNRCGLRVAAQLRAMEYNDSDGTNTAGDVVNDKQVRPSPTFLHQQPAILWVAMMVLDLDVPLIQ